MIMKNERKLALALNFAEESDYSDIRTQTEYTKEALEILSDSVNELTSILGSVATTNELADGEQSVLYRYIGALKDVGEMKKGQG